MTGYRLCRIRTARRPYFISSASLNIRTAEELSFFVWKYPALADDELCVPALVRWVSGELNLPDTALRMEQAMKAGRGPAEILMPMLKVSGYLDDREIKTLTSEISALEIKAQGEILKRKGDALFKLGRFEQAMKIYTEADAAAGNYDRELRSHIWHNIGTSAMQMLEYEKACAAFRRAYEIKKSPENLETLLLALKISKPEDKYKSAAKELGASGEALRKIEEKFTMSCPPEIRIPGDIDAYLENERRTYHIWAGT